MPPLTLETFVWIILTALALTLAGALVLRWLAFRISSHVGAWAEAGVAATLRPGVARTHSRFAARVPVVNAETQRRHMRAVERLAWLMDGVIPLPIIGGIGLDAVLGLIPVGGDVASFAISSLVIVRAAQMGAPPELLSRLIAVQCVDLLIGVVPLIGDLADAGYHANERSVKLLREWMAADYDRLSRSDQRA